MQRHQEDPKKCKPQISGGWEFPSGTSLAVAESRCLAKGRRRGEGNNGVYLCFDLLWPSPWYGLKLFLNQSMGHGGPQHRWGPVWTTWSNKFEWINVNVVWIIPIHLPSLSALRLHEEEWSDNKFMDDYLRWNLKLLSYLQFLDGWQFLTAEAMR